MSVSEEIWLPIKDYEDRYEISNLGNVRSFYGNKFHKRSDISTPLRLWKHSGGYLCVTLKKGGKKKNLYVHRLVGSAFITNYDNKLEINHKNGNKQNNEYSNLEWATRSENLLHKFRVLDHRTGTEKAVIGLKDGIVIYSFESGMDAKRSGLNNTMIWMSIHKYRGVDKYKNCEWRYAS